MYNDIRKNENKGFSLVELIVVIAIMAVLTSVLAPSLLAYVERSRAQKDDSAMGEVTNAVLLALADQDVYDEVLYYTCYGNVSCYIDASQENGNTSGGTALANLKTVTKAGSGSGNTAKKNQYTFGDDARLADETPYYAAGNMRGVTITFQPVKSSNKSSYVLANGIINKFIQSGSSMSTGLVTATQLVAGSRENDTVAYVNSTPTYSSFGTLSTMKSGSNSNVYLYNRVRATVGNEIELTSQTYRNSEYTIFIRMGTTGGAQANAQDAIAVYGQWNGTNLTAN